MDKSLNNKTLIIIPAYNEEENILATISGIKESKEYDYVVINDGSTDNTLKICKDNNINVINLPLNLGIGGAVQTGYMYADMYGYCSAVQIDGDGQHNLDFLLDMKKVLVNENADMVIGSRYLTKDGFQSSVMRRAGIKWFTFLIKILTGKTITDPTSGYRLIGRSGIELFAQDYPKDYPEPETIVAMLCNKNKIVEMPVLMNERQGGKSSITALKPIYYMFKVSLSILLEKFRKHS